MEYVFESPIVVHGEDEIIMSPDQDIVDAINERLITGDYDLAEYLHEDLDLIIASITMEARLGMQGLTCRTTCVADSPLTPGLMTHLIDFITGQFSDGWGETFEQDVFDTCDEDFYASFWWSENWHMDVVGFSKADLN